MDKVKTVYLTHPTNTVCVCVCVCVAGWGVGGVCREGGRGGGADNSHELSLIFVLKNRYLRMLSASDVIGTLRANAAYSVVVFIKVYNAHFIKKTYTYT